MNSRQQYKIALSLNEETDLHDNLNGLVSIVVPVYNVENYIERCVQSIMTQTYSMIEVILVDDGSTDSSADLCEALADKDDRIKVIHKENGGLSSARNAALPLVEGEYLTFVDGDDVIRSQHVEILARALHGDNRGISSVSAISIPNQDSLPNLSWSKVDCLELSQKEALSQMLLGKGLSVSACGKMAHKDIWVSTPFPEDRVYEDLSVMSKIISTVGKVYSVDAASYGQVFRIDSITRKSKMSARQYLDYHAAIHDCCDYAEQMFPGEFEHEVLSRKLLEYARLENLWLDVVEPNEACLRARKEAQRFLKSDAGKWLHGKQIPLAVKTKACIQIISPKLYSTFFRLLQRLKQRRVC